MDYKYSCKDDGPCFNSLDEAIEDFINDLYCDGEINGEGYIETDVNICTPYEDEINAVRIIEKLYEEALDECEFADENYLQNVDTTWLSQELNKVWKKWKKREKISPPFYEVDHIENYKIHYKDDEVISYRKIRQLKE